MSLLPIVHGGVSVSGVTTITLSANVENYNLANDLSNNYGWNGSDAIEVILNVNAGVTVSATATTTPAMVVDLVSGSTLTLNNSGTIVAKGGAGAAGGANGASGSAGGAGGNAISFEDVTVTVNNASGAFIRGGGGGGGGGGGTRKDGSATDSEGVCNNSGASRTGGTGGNGAGPGSATGGGTPGTTAGNGGAGGDFGTAGSSGSGATGSGCAVVNGSGGAGGAAGKAIHHVSSVSQTLNNSGTINGATS